MFSTTFFAAVAASTLFGAVTGLPFPFRRATTLSASFSTLSKPVISPYYVNFGNSNSASLSDAFDEVGLSAATLAFITAKPGQCKITSDLDGMVDDAAAYVAKGGVLTLSFGGAIGSSSTNAHVQQACTSADSLATLIKNALTQFKTHNAEFDIEDDGLMSDSAARTRLATALATVKKSIPDLHITYTLATLPSGMPDAQLAQVEALKDAGVQLDVLALMTMDMVSTGVESSSESAITAGAKQLAGVYGLGSAAALAKMGVIPMIGRDDQGAQFSVSDATALSEFAKSKGIAYVSNWNFNRDFAGSGDLNSQSGAREQASPYQFFKAFVAGAGSGGTGGNTSSTRTSASATSAASGTPPASSVVTTTDATPTPTTSQHHHVHTTHTTVTVFATASL